MKNRTRTFRIAAASIALLISSSAVVRADSPVLPPGGATPAASTADDKIADLKKKLSDTQSAVDAARKRFEEVVDDRTTIEADAILRKLVADWQAAVAATDRAQEAKADAATIGKVELAEATAALAMLKQQEAAYAKVLAAFDAYEHQANELLWIDREIERQTILREADDPKFRQKLDAAEKTRDAELAVATRMIAQARVAADRKTQATEAAFKAVREAEDRRIAEAKRAADEDARRAEAGMKDVPPDERAKRMEEIRLALKARVLKFMAESVDRVAEADAAMKQTLAAIEAERDGVEVAATRRLTDAEVSYARTRQAVEAEKVETLKPLLEAAVARSEARYEAQREQLARVRASALDLFDDRSSVVRNRDLDSVPVALSFGWRIVPEIRMKDISLEDVIDYLRDISGINILVDWQGLEKAGVVKSTPITLDLQNVRFDEVCRAIADAVVLKDKSRPVRFDLSGRIAMVSTDAALHETRAIAETWNAFLRNHPDLAPLLRRRLPECRFNEASLGDVMEFIRDVGGVKIEVDWDALNKVKADAADAPVNIRLIKVELGTVVMMSLRSAGFGPDITLTAIEGGVKISRGK